MISACHSDNAREIGVRLPVSLTPVFSFPCNPLTINRSESFSRVHVPEHCSEQPTTFFYLFWFLRNFGSRLVAWNLRHELHTYPTTRSLLCLSCNLFPTEPKALEHSSLPPIIRQPRKHPVNGDDGIVFLDQATSLQVSTTHWAWCYQASASASGRRCVSGTGMFDGTCNSVRLQSQSHSSLHSLVLRLMRFDWEMAHYYWWVLIFYVRPNLHSALCHIRDKADVMKVWTDAICS
jgi:hypothetical protein